MGMRDARRQGGLGLIEILLALAVLAIASAVLYHYLSSTRASVERLQEQSPLALARLAADQATLGSIQTMLQAYRAQHGRWPPDKAAVLALFPTPPRFQCPGNDLEYEATEGSVRLLITDPGRC